MFSNRISIFKYGLFVIFLSRSTTGYRLEVAENEHNAERLKRSPVAIHTPIYDHPECSIIKDFCGPIGSHDEIKLLACIQNFDSNRKNNIPIACQHVIWTRMSYYMNNTNLQEISNYHCRQEYVIDKCQKTHFDVFVLCILDNKYNIKDVACTSFVQNLEVIVFNDYQELNNFMKKCQSDIDIHDCGRLNAGDNSIAQSETLSCLQLKVDSLKNQCRQEILHLSELQGDNIKLDRLLYTACGIDQIRFCPDLSPGSGLMYKCLMLHKYDKSMSKQCGEQLTRRQRLISQDYKVSKGIARACKEDIRLYRCRKGVSDDKDVRLAQILVCLENILKNNTKISSECQAEMIDHRKMLMEDYSLSPELMHDCADDISHFCNHIETGGKTIHCLMEHARPKQKKERRISASCQRSLEGLVKETDAGEDWRVDPVLRKACKPVVDTACKEVKGGDGRVISCLMEKIGTTVMTEDCETALIQIQYFISRDFKLDPQLYRACKDDAIHFCHAKQNWADQGQQMDPERGPIVLPCLYNYAYNNNEDGHLTSLCTQEVKRVMRQRAISVDLLPEIEDVCIDELANLCYDRTAKGEEILCLQTNLNNLGDKCKAAVTNFTEAQAGHVELNPFINTNCRTVMDNHCSSYLKSGKDDGEIMECLITHKNEPDVRSNPKCRAAIEHFQIISLKNYKFTRKFKDACRSYVMRFCPSSRTKSQVITCLSEIVRNDTLIGNRHSISKDCRQQIRNQLFQQKENIDFEPELQEACKKDLNKYCANVDHSGGLALECLQTFKGKLSDTCRHALFAVKRQEFFDNSVDYNLITSCNDMIDLFCRKTEPSKVLDCLKLHRQEATFDDKCKLVVVHRMIEQNGDYRFNPQLQSSCKPDIRKFCSDIIANEPQNSELQGKVVTCLKSKFRESKLTSSCENKLAELLKEQALNYRLDPLLSTLCKAEIETICKTSDNSETNSDGQVEECLKTALMNRQIVSSGCAHEVAGIIEETKVDIGADPLLQRACALDLLKFCRQLEHGAGRHLKCLQIIYNDATRDLEPECRKELTNRMEMYKYAAKLEAPENFGEIYTQVSSSPAKKYILLVSFSFLGLIFIFGLFCGRMTRRHVYMKTK